MVGYLILGVALLVGVVVLAKWFATANPAHMAKALRIALIVVGGVVGLYLLFSGRAAWALFPLALIAGTLLRRLAAGGGGPFGRYRARPSPGRASEVETSYLNMNLDHESGEMSGTVTAGGFAGRTLDELNFEELITLLRECWTADEQSARVLDTYLDRTQGKDWRERAAEFAGGAGGPASQDAMTRGEACEVLGVGPEAGAEEIKEAHRRLMSKMHPDHGGSTYLAAKINRAKEILLGG